MELKNIRKSFGPRKVLLGASWQLKMGEKVGLVGLNGSGKTTLLRIISGEIPSDGGQVRVDPDIQMGCVSQEARFDDSKTLKEEICDQSIMDMCESLKELETEIAQLSDDDPRLTELVDRYSRLQTEFQNIDGYMYETRLEMILSRMGFASSDLDTPASALSGGQKSRAQLARELLKQPDLLLLDEPGSHLDINALEWLEGFLSSYKGAVLVVSHDRHLLDKVTHKTLELEFGQLRQYSGNYTYYTDQKERARVRQHYDYVNQQQEIAHLKEAIESLRSWGVKGNTRKFARRARSMEKRIERIEVVEKPRKKSKMQLNLEFQKRSGEMVVEAVGLSRSFGDQVLFSGVDFHIRWGEHVAIVGPNGSGKTTLIRTLLGLEPPDNGHVNLGEGLVISYFDQEQRGLNENRTIYDELGESTDLTKEATMYLLSKLLFRGDRAFKKIEQLSGGERNRVVLSKLVYTKANLLVLDEPTNHLDIPSIEVLEDALAAFQGTVILVSHDRHLLTRVVDRVIELDKGEVRFYTGGYEYYLMKREDIE
ncbi:ribosomal protection-like ABC-F family protein [Candidatus Poribacteria bacterium]